MPFNFFRKKGNTPERKRKELAEELEIAKNRLVFDLETKGIKFLLDKMDSNEEYSDLISERRKIDMTYGSEDHVSMYAYKQSNKLSSPADKKELLELLSNQEYAHLKKYIYCCLSSLCSNTNDRKLFNFLMEKILEEEDESTIVSILSRLRSIKKDSNYNIETIKTLISEGTHSVSTAAILALSNTTDPEVEGILLNEFQITDKHMKGMICAPLSTVGTPRSLPVLQEAYKKTRDRFLRMKIEEVIDKIEERELDRHKTS